VVLGVVLAPLVLAACGSGSGSGSGGHATATTSSGGTIASSNAQLKSAGTTMLAQLTKYNAQATACQTQSTPVVCVEAADRTLGGQIHTYANLLAVGHGFSAPSGDLNAARNAAQILANSLEILGDAQPTQANYNQVLNTFNLSAALSQLRTTITTLSGQLG
jgi:hypothetical protein